jgi:hypothetical protein
MTHGVDGKALAALRNAAAVLGKTPADVEADTRVLLAARRQRDLIAAAKPSADARAALDACAAYDVETARIEGERRAERERLYREYRRIRRGRFEAGRAERALAALSREHPELLADLDAPARR